MEEYIMKMTSKGLSLEQAWSVYKNCMLEGGRKCLDEYLSDSEEDNVDKVQPLTRREECRRLLS